VLVFLVKKGFSSMTEHVTIVRQMCPLGLFFLFFVCLFVCLFVFWSIGYKLELPRKRERR
jgi:predicted permease